MIFVTFSQLSLMDKTRERKKGEWFAWMKHIFIWIINWIHTINAKHVVSTVYLLETFVFTLYSFDGLPIQWIRNFIFRFFFTFCCRVLLLFGCLLILGFNVLQTFSNCFIQYSLCYCVWIRSVCDKKKEGKTMLVITIK